MTQRQSKTVFFSPATPKEVTSIICRLKSKKAARKNDVDTKFSQNSNLITSPIICDFLNSCVEQGSFPDALKVPEVPVFKKGDSNQATNYRPISLLSQFSKILEKLVFTRLYSFFEKFDLLSLRQYCFRKTSSTIHTICAIYEKLLKNVDAGLYTCSIFLDLAKAFATVDHAIVLEKMERYCGVRGLAIKFFGSYLSGRKQCTNIDNHMSSFLEVKCGVPQGSSKGPYFFNVHQ